MYVAIGRGVSVFACDYKPRIMYICVGVFTDDSGPIHAGFPTCFQFPDGTTYSLAGKSAACGVSLKKSRRTVSATSSSDDTVLLIS